MISKLIGIKSQLMGGTSLTAGKKKVRAYSWSLAKYVAALKLDEDDLARLQELDQIGKYPVNDKGDDDRIRDRGTMHLEGEDYDQRALAFAHLTAQYGPNALKHIVVSYRDGPVSLEMAERHRDTFLRVLGAENCAGFYGLHGDTGRPHFHLALCAYDLTQKNLNKWGQGFEIEALHIALALCERDDMLPCEPNRRYVADKTGVYHTLSGIKVADKNGQIYRSGQMLRVPGLQNKIEGQILTPDGLEEGAPVPAETTIRILARAALETARDWDGFHRGLARVGIRYQLHEAAGKIVGGHFVPIDAEEDHVIKVKASAIGAGYKKLVARFDGTEFQEPPTDIWHRPFQTLGFVGKPNVEAEAYDRERKQRAAEDERLAKLAAEIATRHRNDGLSSKKTEKAREAKKRKRLGHSPDWDDDPLEEESAKYRAHERDFIDGVKREIERERGAKRGRPRSLPVYNLLWGANATIDQDPPAWLDQYHSTRFRGVREYYDGDVLAFAETRNFVALHSNSRQHKIHALLLAQKKFGTILIEGPRKEREQLVKLSMELGIQLDRSHQADIKKIERRSTKMKSSRPLPQPTVRQQRSRRQGKADNKRTVHDAGRAPVETSDNSNAAAERLRKNRQLRLGDLRYQTQRASRERKHRCNAYFPPYSMPWLEEENEAAQDARGPNPRPDENNRARMKLEAIDRNEFSLTSSTRRHHGYRFLDDEKLVTAFNAQKHWLLLPEVQKRLEAMAAIQWHERRWIASASQRGRVKIENDVLIATRKSDDWAIEFYRQQKNDHRFQVAITLAKLAPKRFTSDLGVHPGIAAWQQAHRAGDAQLASFIAHELDREAIKHGEVTVPIGEDAKSGRTLGSLRDDAANEFRKNIARHLDPKEREVLAKTPSVNAAVYAQFPWRTLSPASKARRPKRNQRSLGARSSSLDTKDR